MKRYQASCYAVRIQRLNETPGSLGVDSPDGALTFWNEVITTQPWFDPEREQIVSIILNARLRALGHSLVSMGSVNETVVHPREVFRAAVAMGAYAVVLMHNHPSGDPAPSSADQIITRKLKDAGEILQVKLVDHVIVGARRTYFSFREAGLL
jgi:DNA repair protein RadC